jgi:DNA replication protein DnaC
MQTLQSECKFETFGDPVLLKMVNAAAELTGHVKAGQPRWLSFVGNSGTGKTYLAKGIAEWCERRYEIGWAESKHWPTFLGKMRGCSHVHDSIMSLCEPRLLVLDEIGMGTDNRDFGVDLLLRVMEGRKTKWTIITSNATLVQLAEVDGRIASRLLRHGDVIECNTTDFALRGKL